MPSRTAPKRAVGLGWISAAVLGLIPYVGGLSNQTPSLPDLPTLILSNFRPEVRSQVRQAYDLALQHPKQAEASGNLGMLLDLYDRPKDASQCYERAHQLDPTSFKWAYYLGSLLDKQ